MRIFCVGIICAVVMAGCAEDDPVTDGGGGAVENEPTVMIEDEEVAVSSLPVVFSNGLEIGRLIERRDIRDRMRVWHKETGLWILVIEETGKLVRAGSPNIYRDPECTTPLIQRSCEPEETFQYAFEHDFDGDSVFRVDESIAPDNNSPVYLIDGERGCINVNREPGLCVWAIEPVNIPLQFALPITIQ